MRFVLPFLVALLLAACGGDKAPAKLNIGVGSPALLDEDSAMAMSSVSVVTNSLRLQR